MSYKCPVRCGGGPYADEHGAVMHAINKSDEKHRGITDKRSAYDALEDGQNHRAETDSGGSKQEDTSDAAENPTFGSADPNVDISEPSDPDDIECKECGGELYDFRQYASGEYHTINGQNVYVRGDFQCSDCGRWWVDE
jgi:hypothetical protein